MKYTLSIKMSEGVYRLMDNNHYLWGNSIREVIEYFESKKSYIPMNPSEVIIPNDIKILLEFDKLNLEKIKESNPELFI